MSQKFNFDNKSAKPRRFGGIFLIFLAVIVVGVTIAFFAASDYASKYVGMSGAVKILAVGEGDVNIEDDENCNLVIELKDGYNRLIPGGEISMPANVKVYRSTTMPLIRAKLDMNVVNVTLDENYSDEMGVITDIYGQISTIIKNNKWYYHTDGYFYYVGDVAQTSTGEETLLSEVDATAEDVVIDFINSDIVFPTYVTSDYSGLGVRFIITFQAIQNYIPDEDGFQLSNTIKNSLKIFNNFDTESLKVADAALFDYETIGSVRYIKIKEGSTYPVSMILPEKDSSGNTITGIHASFANLTNVQDIVVPSGYTTLADGAFKNSTLETIDLSQTAISNIPNECFYNSNFYSIDLPDNLITIRQKAFANTNNLRNIVLPDTLTTIGNRAFWLSNIVTLNIPASVSSIDANGIILSFHLANINVDEDNANYYDKDGKMLIGNNGTLYAFAHAAYTDTALTIPEGVKVLSDYTLSYAYNLRTLSIPSTLQTINEGALAPNLSAINIASGNSKFKKGNQYEFLTSTGTMIKCLIKDRTISYDMSDAVTSVQNNAFNLCEMNVMTIGKNMASAGDTAFAGIRVNKILVNAANTKFKSDREVALIGITDGKLYRFATHNTFVTVYTVDSTVTTICPNAFQDANYITQITLPSNVTRVEDYAFDCALNLSKVFMTNSITYIGKSAFSFTSVADITIYGANVSDLVLSNCSKLKSVTVDNATTVGNQCFYNCPILEKVVFNRTTPPTFSSNIIFSGTTPGTYKIYVPDSAVAAYKAATNFTSQASRIYAVSAM